MSKDRKVTLFTDKDNPEETQEAKNILERNDIPFELSPAHEDGHTLPAVMDREAMYRGLGNIRRMAKMPRD